MRPQKIKSILILFFAFSISLLASPSIGVEFNKSQTDSLDLLKEFSLFYEYHKNKDFLSAEAHGWNIIHSQPEKFLQYRPFRKMEDVIRFLHDSTDVSDERKEALADTILFIFDKGIELKEKRYEQFQLNKAFLLETWHNAENEVIIEAYLKAFEMNPNASTFYKDRLGLLYINNMSESNNYVDKALELYNNLIKAEPDNLTWPERIKGIAQTPEELMDIFLRIWKLDPENMEKAWSYASLCLRNKEYVRAIEALEFLTQKSPDVINYWQQLSTAYDKIDDTDNAINAYKTLIDLQPDNKDNYANLALIYKKLDQLSVARSYLQKASNIDSDWDFPYYVEAQLYEQSIRSCMGNKLEFMDKCVYQLVVDLYRKARSKKGSNAGPSGERVNALINFVPQSEDYFFRQLKSGEKIKIEGNCYSWIGRSITVP